MCSQLLRKSSNVKLFVIVLEPAHQNGGNRRNAKNNTFYHHGLTFTVKIGKALSQPHQSLPHALCPTGTHPLLMGGHLPSVFKLSIYYKY
jgi:hypothetical protein